MAAVLVTGGSGFIGAHLVDALLAGGHEVTNFDIKPPVEERHKTVWFQGDILSKPALEQALAATRPEVILHLAARAEIQSKDLSAFASIHEGTRNLMDVAAASATVRRLVHTSTQFVVGPGQNPKTDTDLYPYTMYGEAKAIAEQELRHRRLSIEWTIVRPTIIWGPGHPSFPRSIWYYLYKRYYLHPGGGQPAIRCYGYVTNTVDQYIAIMNAPAGVVDKRVLYLGDSALDSSIWLDEFSFQLSGHRTRRLPKPLLKILALAGDALNAVGYSAPLDSDRLMRMSTDYAVSLESTIGLAGSPRISLKEGVVHTVAWLRTTYPDLYGTRT
jgi:nucleoside-diphosphate-sugar epimerase